LLTGLAASTCTRERVITVEEIFELQFPLRDVWTLAVASTSAEPAVCAVLTGDELAKHFAVLVCAMLRAATDGLQTRGIANLGDKTLLDALLPATDEPERQVAAGAGGDECLTARRCAPQRTPRPFLHRPQSPSRAR
jgi:hypothetical protein